MKHVVCKARTTHCRIWVSPINGDHALPSIEVQGQVPVVRQVSEEGVMVANNRDKDTPICSSTQSVRGSVTHLNFNLKHMYKKQTNMNTSVIPKHIYKIKKTWINCSSTQKQSNQNNNVASLQPKPWNNLDHRWVHRWAILLYIIYATLNMSVCVWGGGTLNCVCVHMHVCVWGGHFKYVFKYVCVHTWVCVHACVYVCAHVHVCVHPVFFLSFSCFCFEHFIIPCRKFGWPYLGKATAATKAVLPIPASVHIVFSCVQTNVCLPVFGIVNMHSC